MCILPLWEWTWGSNKITHCSCYFLKICIRGHYVFDWSCIVKWFKVIKSNLLYPIKIKFYRIFFSPPCNFHPSSFANSFSPSWIRPDTVVFEQIWLDTLEFALSWICPLTTMANGAKIKRTRANIILYKESRIEDNENSTHQPQTMFNIILKQCLISYTVFDFIHKPCIISSTHRYLRDTLTEFLVCLLECHVHQMWTFDGFFVPAHGLLQEDILYPFSDSELYYIYIDPAHRLQYTTVAVNALVLLLSTICSFL